MLQNTERLDTINNNDPINQVQPTRVVQEDDQDSNVIQIPRAYANEIIEASKGIDDGSQLFSPKINARIGYLFGKAANSPAEKVNDILDEIFRISGCLD